MDVRALLRIHGRRARTEGAGVRRRPGPCQMDEMRRGGRGGGEANVWGSLRVETVALPYTDFAMKNYYDARYKTTCIQ